MVMWFEGHATPICKAERYCPKPIVNLTIDFWSLQLGNCTLIKFWWSPLPFALNMPPHASFPRLLTLTPPRLARQQRAFFRTNYTVFAVQLSLLGPDVENCGRFSVFGFLPFFETQETWCGQFLYRQSGLWCTNTIFATSKPKFMHHIHMHLWCRVGLRCVVHLRHGA